MIADQDPVSDLVPDDVRVIFCVSCFRRDMQLLAAMAINCAVWWSLRRHWRLAICTFGQDEATIATIKKHFDMFIKIGVLVIGSGGRSGELRWSEGMAEAPRWMPNYAAGRGLDDGEGRVRMPWFEYWHASTGKHAAHQVGNHCFGANACFVSLDCDQIVPLEYVSAVLAMYAVHRDVPGMCITCGGHGPLTGRLGYRGKDFFELGGYDEFETPPSGGQDIDMRDRLLKYAEANPGRIVIPKKGLKIDHDFGSALPNDFTNTSRGWDRGGSKTVHVHPDTWERFGVTRGTKEWGQLAHKGWKLFEQRTKAGHLTRNVELLQNQISIGAWFCVIVRHFNQEDDWMRSATPPLSSSVIIEPDFEDEHECQDADTDAQSFESAEPIRAATKTSITLCAVGARELHTSVKTLDTPLGPMCCFLPRFAHTHVCQFLISCTLTLMSRKHLPRPRRVEASNQTHCERQCSSGYCN